MLLILLTVQKRELTADGYDDRRASLDFLGKERAKGNTVHLEHFHAILF